MLLHKLDEKKLLDKLDEKNKLSITSVIAIAQIG